MTGQLPLFDMAPIPEPDNRCVDCRVDVFEVDEWYMVHDHVWPIDPLGGVLCVGCLEQRIGRELTAADFTDAPCNRWTRSRRLDERRTAR